jgi:hypothetical protein
MPIRLAGSTRHMARHDRGAGATPSKGMVMPASGANALLRSMNGFMVVDTWKERAWEPSRFR